MKNKLFRAFTLVLLTLTLISQSHFYFDFPSPCEPAINACGPKEEEPLDDGDDKPLCP